MLLLIALPFFPLSLRAQSPGDASGSDADIGKLFDAEKEKAPEDSSTVQQPDRSGAMFSYTDYAKRSYQLDMMATGDIVGEWDKNKDRPTIHQGRDPRLYWEHKWDEWNTPARSFTDNSVAVRSTEVGMYADIDQLAEGTVIVAAHDKGGTPEFDVHEVSFNFPVTFLPNTSIKVGKFLVDAGRLNTLHQHDWSFTRTPVAHQQLMGDEGVSDTGAEFHILMPWNFWQELTLGVYNGRTFGESATPGPKKRNPLVNVHLKQFLHLGGEWGTQFGFTYLRWNPEKNPKKVTQQSGLDFLVKWRRNNQRSFQWLTEVWYRQTDATKARPFDAPPDPMDVYAGGYSFVEYQFHQQWSVGARYDYFTHPSLMAENGYVPPDPITLTDSYGRTAYLFDGWTKSYSVKNGITEASVMVTYMPSEFSHFRATVTDHYDKLYAERDWIFSLQGTFIIGKHPAHKY